LRQVLEQVKSRSVTVVDVGLRRPTLDDVFLSLTGHVAEEEEQPDGGTVEEIGTIDTRDKEPVS
jgi:ABC-2 type transport system ATP-binding protein